jgi:hypothetical protein
MDRHRGSADHLLLVVEIEVSERGQLREHCRVIDPG